jgi:hypothetical protein
MTYKPIQSFHCAFKRRVLRLENLHESHHGHHGPCTVACNYKPMTKFNVFPKKVKYQEQLIETIKCHHKF